MSEVQDALAERHVPARRAENDTATLVTIVSDLGNNGLPIQYVGSPPTGFEIPFIGFDWNVLEITTGDLDEIDVSFDPTPLLFVEGDRATRTIRPSPSRCTSRRRRTRRSRSSGTPTRRQAIRRPAG